MSERGYVRLLAAGAAILAAVLAWHQGSFWDYPTDAGPALAAVARGSISGFFAHQPAMGPLSLYVRAPFVILARGLHDGTTGYYRWGALPCLLSVAAVAVWMAQVAARRGAGRLAMALIVAVSLLNPLVMDALYWGHPEELLTASLAVGALIAAVERRGLLAAVLVGLAIASKQWALLLLVPTVLILERDRVRTIVMSLSLAALAWLPMALANLGAFRRALHYVSHPQSVVTVFTWLYPFTPRGSVTVGNMFGDVRTFQGHQLLGLEAMMTRPLITLVGVAIPLLVWWRTARRPSAHQVLVATAVVLVCRCALDPGAMPYYHFPLLLTLVACDAVAGRRVPVLALTAAATTFVVLDRFPSYLTAAPANLAYIAASATSCVLLVRALNRSSKGKVGMLAPAVFSASE